MKSAAISPSSALMALTIPANYSLRSSANLNVYHPKLYALLWLLSNPQKISQDNLQQLFGPMGQLQAANLVQDPLLLFARYLQAQNPSSQNIEQDVVVVQDRERHWALLLSELQDSDLKLDKLALLRDLTTTTEKLIRNQGGELLVSGLPLFTAHGAHTAQQEISTIGVRSSIGVVLLLFLTFRSPRPLLLCGLACCCVWCCSARFIC